MREFFRGWKRKFGVVTLITACVFSAGWIRSLSTLDQINRPKTPYREDKFQSVNGCLVWMSDLDDVKLGFGGGGANVGNADADPVYDMTSEWTSGHIITEAFFRPDQKHPEIVCTFRFLGIGVGKFRNTSVGVYFIRYESIVIPLILLSAYLLLSKPRTTNPKPGSEP